MARYKRNISAAVDLEQPPGIVGQRIGERVARVLVDDRGDAGNDGAAVDCTKQARRTGIPAGPRDIGNRQVISRDLVRGNATGKVVHLPINDQSGFAGTHLGEYVVADFPWRF